MKKKIRINNIDSIDFINDQIWEGFNVLRGDVSTENFNFILYLMVLRSRDIMPNLDVDVDLESVLNLPAISSDEIIDPEEREVVETLYLIHDTFSEIISHLRPKTWTSLYTLFKDIDGEILKDNLDTIFEEQLLRLVKLQGKAGGHFSLPTEIAKFLIDIAEPPKISTIYDPFAGFGTCSLFLEENQVYVAQELNRTAYTVAVLRLIAHRRLSNSYIFNQNALKEWVFSTRVNNHESNSFLKHFDLVISAPPFNARLPKDVEGQFGAIRTIEHFFIENGISALKDTGKLIAIVSLNFLSITSGSELQLREYLVKNDLLETVIAFPGGLLSHTSIRFAVIVLNRNKKNKGYFRFIDARDYATDISRLGKKLKGDALIDLLKSNSTSEYSRDVSMLEIEASDFSFNPGRYLLSNSLESDSPLIALGDVVRIRLRESPIQPGTKGKFIRIRDLKSDLTNLVLNLDDIEFTDIPASAMEFKNATLLLALRYNNLKPSLINGSNEKMFVSNDILPLHVYEDKIDPAYLLSELNSDFVKKQVEAYGFGSSIQSISKKDVLNLKIRVPNMVEQKARVHRIREEILRSKHRELELTREILGLKDDSFKEFASIKHTLSQYLNALKSNVSGTIKFISRNQGINIKLETVYSENLNQNLGEHLQSLEQTIDSMSKLLHSAGQESEKSELAAIEMEMDLSRLVRNAQNRFKNTDFFLFEALYIDQESFSFGDGTYISTFINILADDFYRIFSNIVANAIDHGFKGRSGNIIRTSLSYDWENEKLVLEISNNGHPLPAEFTIDHLTTRGEKSIDSRGMGMGGADIKGLLGKYDAKVDLRKQEGEGFPVTYVLTFNLAVTVL